MIIPGFGNKWGLEPTIPLDGWIEITEDGKKLHWTRDRVAEWEMMVEWHKMNPGKSPQTTRDLIWFNHRYKFTEV